jgi:hypothetical protein
MSLNSKYTYQFGIIFFPKMAVNVARKESDNSFQVQDVMNHSNVCFP